MSFYDIYKKYSTDNLDEMFCSINAVQVQAAINSARHDERQLAALLSPAGRHFLEEMAQKAHYLTLKNFGSTIQLYTPIYVSDYCENKCLYCGFNAENSLSRKKLSLEEVEEEARIISEQGLEHILLLSGDSRSMSPLSYIIECVKILRKYFSSVSVEIYALSLDEYARLAAEGVDGVTLYQETYDHILYDKLHVSGPKKDYLFRLEAPERAARAGIRSVNVGALLGINEWRKDVFFMAMHAKYLQDRYSDTEVGASIPRLRPYSGSAIKAYAVSNAQMVQIITALRIVLPRLGISLSTRESAPLRESLLPLGITRMSAGSSTRVGGRTAKAKEPASPAQFEISDTRDVTGIKAMLAQKGYQPVLKDWMHL